MENNKKYGLENDLGSVGNNEQVNILKTEQDCSSKQLPDGQLNLCTDEEMKIEDSSGSCENKLQSSRTNNLREKFEDKKIRKVEDGQPFPLAVSVGINEMKNNLGTVEKYEHVIILKTEQDCPSENLLNSQVNLCTEDNEMKIEESFLEDSSGSSENKLQFSRINNFFEECYDKKPMKMEDVHSFSMGASVHTTELKNNLDKVENYKPVNILKTEHECSSKHLQDGEVIFCYTDDEMKFVENVEPPNVCQTDQDYSYTNDEEIKVGENLDNNIIKKKITSECIVPKKIDKEVFACSHCSYTSFEKMNLNGHLSTFHGGPKDHSCPHCPFKTAYKYNLKKHIQCHVNPHLKCPNCSYRTALNYRLKKHLRTHSEKRNHPCSECGFQGETEDDLKMHHTKKHSEDSLKCLHCPYRTTVKTQMTWHLATHTGDKTFKCPHCSYASCWPSAYHTHMKTHPKNNDSLNSVKTSTELVPLDNNIDEEKPSEKCVRKKKHKCSLCWYSTTKKSNLQDHLVVHSGKKLDCPHCPFKTAYRYTLKKHIEGHTDCHIKCPECPYKTVLNSRLRLHLQIHSENKDYECPDCSYKTRTKASLREHKRRKHMEERLKCEHCPFVTSLKGKLRMHMVKHTGEKNFKCALCPFTSGWKAGLYVHTKTHYKERKFKCSLCSYQGQLKHHLEQHMKTHTGEKEFKCSLCSYQGAFKHHLKQHLKSHHKLVSD